ncbi:MAG: ArsR family transcriptional regulator [Candidatus Lokiarchaeota archaeon]|nr:ArsR family transcriptional regulator [Candidatus Lokiarchaeota archaeon]
MENHDTTVNNDHNFKDLNNKLASLQDILLKMKVDYDLTSRNQIKTEMSTQLLKSTEEMVNIFLDNRPPNCEVLNQCSTSIQKATMKILRVLSEKGYQDAKMLVNKYIDIADSYFKTGICNDESCIENAKSMLLNIRDLLFISNSKATSSFNEMLKREVEFDSFEGNEKHESKLMSVLGNEMRIKILKELTRGSNHYSHLERILGLKGGHFHFHLKELKNAGFVEVSDQDKTYHITTRGLKALKMLFEICKE